MQTQVTFRHMKSRSEFREEAMEAMGKFEKFSDSITSSNVEFIADTSNIVEITVHINGKILVVKEQSEDFMKSLHEAADKMIRQLKKQKDKNQRTKGIDLSSFIF